MASINFLRQKTNNQKRRVSVFATRVVPANVTTDEGFDADGTIASGDTIHLANIPDNSVVTKATVQVTDGLTGGTQTVQLAVGGVEVMAAVALGTADNVTKGTTTQKKVEGALVLTAGVADMVDGEFEVLIEYIETNLVTGELTVSQ